MLSLLFLAKSTGFVLYKCVVWLQRRSCFAANLCTWLWRACVGTRNSISLNFSRPGLLSTMFSGSRAEVVLRQFFVTWLCRACVRTRGLISLKFSRPGLVYEAHTRAAWISNVLCLCQYRPALLRFWLQIDLRQLSIDDNIDVQSAFSWASKVARKCESKHW